MTGDAGLTSEDYQRLLRFRAALRRFLRWSEDEAGAAGLTPAQHQLLLAIRGHRGEGGPTIGEVAECLMLRHHSVVELVDRAAGAGLVRRVGDKQDHRVVHLSLTTLGMRRIEKLSQLHLEELARLAPFLAGGEDAAGSPRR